jgi:hypothetical protein
LRTRPKYSEGLTVCATGAILAGFEKPRMVRGMEPKEECVIVFTTVLSNTPKTAGSIASMIGQIVEERENRG